MSWIKTSSDGRKDLEWKENVPMTVKSAYDDIIQFYEERTGASDDDILHMKKSLKRIVSFHQKNNERVEAVEAMERFVNFQIETEFSN